MAGSIGFVWPRATRGVKSENLEINEVFKFYVERRAKIATA
jgi:hypothetical protein